MFNTAIEGSMYVANSIAELIDSRNKESKSTVLGLATGSTPTQVYDELVRRHKEEGLSFERVITFNLDEYYPMSPDAHQVIIILCTNISLNISILRQRIFIYPTVH